MNESTRIQESATKEGQKRDKANSQITEANTANRGEETMTYDLDKSIKILQYRNEKYPIYAYADHAYIALVLLFAIVGFAYLVMFNVNWYWFELVALFAFVFGALTGVVEKRWIEAWMMKDEEWMRIH